MAMAPSGTEKLLSLIWLLAPKLLAPTASSVLPMKVLWEMSAPDMLSVPMPATLLEMTLRVIVAPEPLT